MKKNLVVIISVIAAIFALILVGVVIFCVVNNNNKNPLLKDADLGKAKISNVSIIYENNLSTYRAVVTAKEDVMINYIVIKVSDKNKNTKELTGYVGKEVKKDEKINIISSIDVDITDYNIIQYEIK